jgi:hypothetical protein
MTWHHGDSSHRPLSARPQCCRSQVGGAPRAPRLRRSVTFSSCSAANEHRHRRHARWSISRRHRRLPHLCPDRLLAAGRASVTCAPIAACRKASIPRRPSYTAASPSSRLPTDAPSPLAARRASMWRSSLQVIACYDGRRSSLIAIPRSAILGSCRHGAVRMRPRQRRAHCGSWRPSLSAKTAPGHNSRLASPVELPDDILRRTKPLGSVRLMSPPCKQTLMLERAI